MCNLARAAHFLLVPELADSPPNDALIKAYQESGMEVDLYAPGSGVFAHKYGPSTRTFAAQYGFRWLTVNAFRPSWRTYRVFSGTAEDPLGVVGALSRLHRRPAVALVDEIRAGSYGGNTRESWRRLSRAAVRGASLRIVNDRTRVELLRDYAGLSPLDKTIVFPGSYVEPPLPVDVASQRRQWGVPSDRVVVGFSGGFNLTAGADWLIDALDAVPDLHAIIQPLAVSELTRYLLTRLRHSERTYIEINRLDWREAWAQAAAFDVGLAVYLNPAPQFQHMGTSSNRLCMYLAMGVPVIASRQESFRFLEDYECGFLVSSGEEFTRALRRIRERLSVMRENARRCWREYVGAKVRYRELLSAVRGLR